MKLDDLYATLRYVASNALEVYEMQELDHHMEIREQSEVDLAQAINYVASVTLGTSEFNGFTNGLRFDGLENLRAAIDNLASRVLIGGQMREFRELFPNVGIADSMETTVKQEPTPNPEPEPDYESELEPEPEYDFDGDDSYTESESEE